MHRDRPGAHGGGRLEHREAVPAGGVADHLAGADGAGADELGDDVLEHVVGHGEQQQVAGPGDGGRLGDAHPGQQRGDALARGGGLTGGGHDLVTGAPQSGGQDGTDTAGTDNPDSGHLTSSLSFQSLAGTGLLTDTVHNEVTPRRFRAGTDRGCLVRHTPPGCRSGPARPTYDRAG